MGIMSTIYDTSGYAASLQRNSRFATATLHQAWLILRAHRARALGPRPLGGPQKWERRVEDGRERGEKEKRKK